MYRVLKLSSASQSCRTHTFPGTGWLASRPFFFLEDDSLFVIFWRTTATYNSHSGSDGRDCLIVKNDLKNISPMVISGTMTVTQNMGYLECRTMSWAADSLIQASGLQQLLLCPLFKFLGWHVFAETADHAKGISLYLSLMVKHWEAF